MRKISQGAEAKIYTDKNTIVKDRFSKKYRHPKIDESLRKSRTKSEAKILERLKSLKFPVPEVKKSDPKKGILELEKLEGKKLRDIFNKEYKKYAKDIGKLLAKIHSEGIIHGDLTTSNMIVKEDKLYFIDFGLSFFSDRIEDKAVDLHLLKQAIESKHYKVYKEAFKIILDSYSENCRNTKEVLKRFEAVETRGRNKAKY